MQGKERTDALLPFAPQLCRATFGYSVLSFKHHHFCYSPDIKSRKRNAIINISLFRVNNFFQKNFQILENPLKNKAEIASSSLRNH
jgi:hypothetical protein